MVEWLSYSLEFILAIISGLFVGIVLHWYTNRDQQTAETQENIKNWYVDTIEYAQRVQRMKKNWKERSIPQHSETQRKIKAIAEDLSSHRARGEHLNVDDSTLTLVEETAKKCREVTRANTELHAVGISSEIKAANKSAEELEQSTKKKL
ncbi:hypothetical protein [Halococcus sediminicola]|uniref:hypothetical protein n=1 Tax=Halococcus sediminicola TaxID=1264579 RepID=UPI0006785486|nr:hypothetical protein [Halococcus sediminicola]